MQDGSIQVSPRQLSLGQHGVGEIHAGQVGPPEVRRLQPAPAQLRAAQPAARQAAEAEVCPAQVSVAQVQPGEVGGRHWWGGDDRPHFAGGVVWMVLVWFLCVFSAGRFLFNLFL